MIQVHGYDMVRLDGCTNDKTPYKKDPIMNNGFVGDAKSFGGAEYKHGQQAVKAINLGSGGGGGGASPQGGSGASKVVEGEKKSSSSQLAVALSTLAIVPLVCAYFF
jgi:hypothetical protein